MRSANADRFNHDDDAPGYDADVLDESNPIRAGYDQVLDWVAARTPPDSVVVDLGCGTGNLARRIRRPRRLIGVDVSGRMLEIAATKLSCELVRADLLEVFATLPVVDAIVSTYAVHHLTAAEKRALFRACRDHLAPGGLAVFGDLMFADVAAEHELLARYRTDGRGELADDICDEFFWHVDDAIAALGSLGFEVEHERISELSWVIAARRSSGDAALGEP